MLKKFSVKQSLIDAFEQGKTWSSKNLSDPKFRRCHDHRIRQQAGSADADNATRDLIKIKGIDLRDAIVHCVEKNTNPNNRYWIDGAHIVGDVDLQGLHSNGWLSINNTIFSGNLITKHTHLGNLYLCNVYFDQLRENKELEKPGARAREKALGLSAPGLRTTGGLRLGAPTAPLNLGDLNRSAQH